jgi:prepilin-type N-terminal cleavage/methylation domain-containing protein
MKFSTAVKNSRSGFTLIELLIVIAIILILIAIALPNFLASQTRAKLARVQSEQRSYSTAMEAYFLDWKKYPREDRIYRLTTPTAYIQSLSRDPFAPAQPGRFNFIHEFDPFYFIITRNPKESSYTALLSDFNIWTGYPSEWVNLTNDQAYKGRVLYQIRSIGPNQANEYGSRYDPTNGLISNGDVNWFGPFHIERPYGPIPAP